MGASGYLGGTIYKKLKQHGRDEIYGTCCRGENPEFIKANVLDKSDIKRVLLFEPDVIIWSILEKEQGELITETGVKYIIDNASKDVRFIYVSTTVGQGKDQTEEVIPHKRHSEEYLSEYVNGKIKGESIVSRHDNHVIVRPGNIYGYDYDGNMDNRMKQLMEVWKSGKEYSRTANMYASFVNVQELSDAIIELAYGKFTGTLNIASENPVSHYVFNKYLANLMNIDSGFIIADYREKDEYHNLSGDKRRNVLSTEIRDMDKY